MCRSLTKNSRCNKGNPRHTGRRLGVCVGIFKLGYACNWLTHLSLKQKFWVRVPVPQHVPWWGDASLDMSWLMFLGFHDEVE